MNFGIYIHIPFCKQKCFYCDFASVTTSKALKTNSDIYQSYINALCQEIAMYQERFPDICIDTIYFGGGTPSILPPYLIAQVINKLKDKWIVNENIEVTLEANPGTVDEAYLKSLFTNGINRLSFGVQAVQDDLLKKIGRIHTIDEANQAIMAAKVAGFSNISVDLMYGLPTQSLEMLKESVAWSLDKDVQHISIYGLQVEEDTVFGRLYEQNKLILPDEDDVESMYEFLTKELVANGYTRYEISNFAKTGYESKHNLSYWQDKNYLGLGAGAHGYFDNKRIQNPFDLSVYIEKCNKEIMPSINEELVDKKTHVEEFCFLALRMAKGIDKHLFYEKFALDIENIYGEKIKSLCAKNLLIEDDNNIYLTNLGMKFGNQVFSEFLLDIDLE